MHGKRWRARMACSMTVSLTAAVLPGTVFADDLAASPNLAIAQAAAVAAGAELYLDVTLNGEPTGKLVSARQGPRGLLVSRADLRQLGLDRGALAADAAPPGTKAEASDDIALDSIAGLTYKYDPSAQSLALSADDSLRTPFSLAARLAVRAPRATATPGAVVNYNGILQSGRQGGGAAAVGALEARVFDERGVFSTSGVASSIGGHHRFVRHDSFWSESDADTLRTHAPGRHHHVEPELEPRLAHRRYPVGKKLLAAARPGDFPDAFHRWQRGGALRPAAVRQRRAAVQRRRAGRPFRIEPGWTASTAPAKRPW